MSSAEELDMLRSMVRGLAGSPEGLGLDSMVELGLLGLLVSERHGGAGWCPIEAALVADEVGRSVSVGGAESPTAPPRGSAWLAVALGAAALEAGGDPTGQLAMTLDGTAPVVAAAGRLDVANGRANGALVGVDLPPRAAGVAVISPDGGLHLVDLVAPTVQSRPDPTSIDTTRALVRLDVLDAPVTKLGGAVAVRNAAWVLAAATSLGSLRSALDRLVPYLSDRIAFGVPIASFQAIQHRIVDLALLEIRAGVAIDAAAQILAADPAGSTRLAAAAHAFAVELVPPALDECIQLTGGIGFTWEYPLHHELRRAVADGTTFGTARQSREALLEVTGWA